MTQLSGDHRPDTQPPETPPDLHPRVSSWAVVSLVLGIVAAVLFLAAGSYAIFPLLAVVSGHLARHEIRAGRRWGNGLAITGLALGYFIIAVGTVAAIAAA